MNRGKRKCEELKTIRKIIANKYGLTYNPTECTHEGNCSGTCPKCDAELIDLQRQLDEKGIEVTIEEELAIFVDVNGHQKPLESEPIRLAGMPVDPELYVRKDFIIPEGQADVLQGDITDDPDDFTELDIDLPYHNRNRREPKTLFRKCKIAGLSFHDLDDIWDDLTEGTKLALVRHAANEHDRNAVAIALYDDYEGDPEDFDFDLILGYVPRTENAEIAALLDMGWQELFECKISNMSPRRRHGEIEISIYLKNKHQSLEKGNCLWAMELDMEEYLYTRKMLMENGHLYFRWGGYNPDLDTRIQPDQGDRIVLIHNKDEEESVLYLAYITAVDEQCMPFVKDSNLIHATDDCLTYILTLIMGPITVQAKEIAFLDSEDIDTQPTEIQAEETSKKLMDIFKNKG